MCARAGRLGVACGGALVRSRHGREGDVAIAVGVCVVCVRVRIFWGPVQFLAKFFHRRPLLGGHDDVSPFAAHFAANAHTSPHTNLSQMASASVATPITVTMEARACAANAGVEDLIGLMAAYETRTTIDLRSLCNLGHGKLKKNSGETGAYADNLKTLDDHYAAATAGYVKVMPHGATTYIAGLIDVVLDAVALYEAQTYVGMGSATGTGTAASEIAKAMVEAQERSKLEATKEVTPTHEGARHAVIYGLYKLNLREDEYGNRNAQYKADKHMGPDSTHQYPSMDQMPYMGVRDAQGGGKVAPLAPQVGEDGSLGVGPGELGLVAAANAYAVANQAKLKMGTLFLELCGVPLPAGYDGMGVGLVPGNNVSTQMGMEEYRGYCASVDRGAKEIANKAVLEHLIDNNEKLLRSSTSPANHLSLAAALALRTPALDQAIDAHAIAKLHYGVPAVGAAVGRIPKAKDTTPKGDDDGPKGDGLGGLGQGGAFSHKQIAAMRRQTHPYTSGKGGGGWQGGKGGGWQGGKGGGKGGWWQGGGNQNGGWQGGGWQGGGGNQNGGGWQGGGGGPPNGPAPGGPPAPGGGKVVCRDFLAGNCARGANCRFSH